jgi:endo-1,4-beta-mannosidase
MKTTTEAEQLQKNFEINEAERRKLLAQQQKLDEQKAELERQQQQAAERNRKARVEQISIKETARLRKTLEAMTTCTERMKQAFDAAFQAQADTEKAIEDHQAAVRLAGSNLANGAATEAESQDVIREFNRGDAITLKVLTIDRLQVSNWSSLFNSTIKTRFTWEWPKLDQAKTLIVMMSK